MTKIFILTLLLLNILFAQTLSLDEAINKAINKHPDIKHFILQVDKSRSGVDIAQADYLPQIGLNAEYDLSRTYVLQSNGSFNTTDDDGYAIGATLQQKIWDFSKTRNNINAQEENINIAKLSLTDAKAYLAYKVKLQYELIYVQRVTIKVRQKDLQAKKELYKQAQALVNQGMKTSADASRFLSSFYIAKDNLAISVANFDKGRNTLSIYIGEEVSSDIVLDNSLNITYKELNKENILNSSPLLKALKKGIEKSSLEYKSIKASHYGSIDAIASYTHQNTLNQYDSSILGVTLNIPLYNGGRTSALVEQAEINKKDAEAQYNSKVLALKEEINSLLIDIKRYKETILAKKAQLEAATQTNNILEARYKEGLATYIEILDASALQLDAKLGLIRAKYERSSALHRLEYLEGKI